jgi:DNA-binding response OmpR family regulator
MERLTVLVVDDNQAHGEGLTELLAMYGFHTLHASNGQEGLRLANENPVDAVLLDINLPDMSGHEVCAKLRESKSMARVAIIFHTGSEERHWDDGRSDAYLTYPVATSDLIHVIRGCVARRRAIAT